MRTIMGGTSLVLVALTLVGCGQTGPLVLPNDPNENRKTQYLIYKEEPKATTEQAPSEQPTETSTESQK
jgi:predicted small lipoprotein YifL